MNIVEAIKDENLFRPFLGSDIASWRNWLAVLRAVYGLPIKAEPRQDFLAKATGRSHRSLPRNGFDQALFLTGRRSGKSRIAAIIAAYEAVLSGRDKLLAPGEMGLVTVIAPTLKQSRIVHSYTKAIFQTPILREMVLSATKETFELSNNVRIEILAGDWRTVRGFTLLACVLDEACFFGLEAESKVKSDTELVRAIKPALATTQGRLIAISSPYARKGWCYDQWARNHGNDSGNVLVVNAASRDLNPTLPQSIVDEALAEDRASAMAEYMGEWRDDVSEYLPRPVIEEVVCQGRSGKIPNPLRHTKYSAFVDMSGGRSDDAVLAIGHIDRRIVVVDYIERAAAPFDPYAVARQFSRTARQYGCRRVYGDNYAAEFVSEAFRSCGMRYERCEKNKSELYVELLPRICSREIELPDNEMLINQLASLERRTRSGGKDLIDHPRGQKDDVANAVAGLADIAAKRVRTIGAL